MEIFLHVLNKIMSVVEEMFYPCELLQVSYFTVISRYSLRYPYMKQ